MEIGFRTGWQTGSSLAEAVEQMLMIIDSSRHYEVFDAYRKPYGEAQIKIS
jgi:hypothetical protein